jgi:ABC-type arginine/histidine transport system permease subunit
LSGQGTPQYDPALRAVVPDTPWTPAPYAANWADFGAGEATGAYRRDALGWVVLKGLVKKAVALVANDVILTLPATGLVRPATEHIFACASAAGYTEIRVNPNGTVFIVAGGSAVFTSLAGVRYDPAT